MFNHVEVACDPHRCPGVVILFYDNMDPDFRTIAEMRFEVVTDRIPDPVVISYYEKLIGPGSIKPRELIGEDFTLVRQWRHILKASGTDLGQRFLEGGAHDQAA